MKKCYVCSAIVLLAVSSADVGYASAPDGRMASVGDVVNGISLEPSYSHRRSVWPSDSLETPKNGARLNEPVNPSVPAVDVGVVSGLAVGMTGEQVLALAGTPLYRGGNRRWEYLVRGNAGLFIGSIWFNDSGRLWMASTSGAPSAEALRILRWVEPEEPAPQAEPPAVQKIRASELFEFDSAQLRAEQHQLDRLVASLVGRSFPAKVRIRGYSDRLGSEAYNQTLSQQRAEAVRQYLIGKGLRGDTIEARGMGEAAPIAQCSEGLSRKALIDCLAPNRRVEIEVITMKSSER